MVDKRHKLKMADHNQCFRAAEAEGAWSGKHGLRMSELELSRMSEAGVMLNLIKAFGLAWGEGDLIPYRSRSFVLR